MPFHYVHVDLRVIDPRFDSDLKLGVALIRVFDVDRYPSPLSGLAVGNLFGPCDWYILRSFVAGSFVVVSGQVEFQGIGFGYGLEVTGFAAIGFGPSVGKSVVADRQRYLQFFFIACRLFIGFEQSLKVGREGYGCLDVG